MRPISIAILATVLALAGTAHADDAPTTPPVDREASLARAPQFTAKMDAALGQPIATLYQAALGNDPEAVWTYGLAMDAKRDNMDSVPKSSVTPITTTPNASTPPVSNTRRSTRTPTPRP